MGTQTTTATLERFDRDSEPDAIHAAIERDGAVIVEHLLTADVVARVNDEVGAALDQADPAAAMFNPVMQAFHGPCTRQVAGAPGLSPTFAVDVMCHPLLLALADRILLPSCARYQLNLGHLLQRGPGAEEQWLHRDEAVWSDMPRPGPELQLATVIAFVDFTRENGATRVVPGSHRWPDRALSPAEQVTGPQPAPEQIAYAEMPAGSAVVYLGGTIHARRLEHHRHPSARRASQLLPRLAADRGEQLLVDPAGARRQAPAPGPGAHRLRRARQHPEGRWLPRDGAHAGPRRAVTARRTHSLTRPHFSIAAPAVTDTAARSSAPATLIAPAPSRRRCRTSSERAMRLSVKLTAM